MRQFGLCRIEGKSGWFVVLQHDLLDPLATVIVAPLRPAQASAQLSGVLFPAVEVGEDRFVIMIPQMAAITTKSIKQSGLSLRADRDAIMAAIDRTFFGI